MEPGQSRPGPEEVFADWLKSLDPEREGDVESLCALHPELEAELRAIHADWLRLRPVLIRTRESVPLAEALARRHGAAVDPEISLDAALAEPQTSTSSRFLRELASRGVAGSRYRLLGEVARGGMGAILRVWDQDLRRNLAMKVVLGREEPAPQSGTPPVDARQLARFLEEAQITAQLDHPGVVPVHELGLAADGRVYFTMRLVKGRELKEIFALAWRGEEGWSTPRALGAILRVCEAMGYAHDKGVVHRDLKPSNVMVGRHGEVYVMDWGLARVIGRADRHDLRLAEESTARSAISTARADEDDSHSPLRTMDGDVVGTPTYMSPEQAQGRVADIGPRSDVYSIGAMLYHLLARTPPFVPAGARVSQRTVLVRLLEGPPRPLIELAPDTPEELVAICEKAMSREPARRYAVVGELAEDLRAYLENRVVRAHRTGAVIELKKWMARNRGMAAAVAAAIVIALGGLASVSVVQANAARRVSALAGSLQTKNAELSKVVGDLEQARELVADNQRLLARQKEEMESITAELGRRNSALESVGAEAAKRQADVEYARRDLEAFKSELTRLRESAWHDQYVASITLAAASLAAGEAGDAQRALAECETSLRGWEWRYLAAASDNSIAVLRGHEDEVVGVDFSGDGALLASCSLDKTARVWDTTTHECLRVLQDHGSAVTAVKFAPGNAVLASGSVDGEVIVWSAETWEPLRSFQCEGAPSGPFAVVDLDFSPDGATLATAWQADDAPPCVDVWSVSTGERVRRFELDERYPQAVRFSRDGRRLGALTTGNRLYVFDVASGARVVATSEGEGLGEIYYTLSFAPDGGRIACGSVDSVVRVLDAATGSERALMRGHTSQVIGAAFSPDGRTLASASLDRTVTLWDGESSARLGVLAGHVQGVACVAFSPDGERIASGSGDRTVRLWDPACASTRTTLEQCGSAVTFSPDGRYLIGPGHGVMPVVVHDLELDAPAPSVGALPKHTYDVLLEPRGRWLALADATGAVHLWDWKDKRELARLKGHAERADALATNADGSLLATGSRDDSIRVWSTDSHALVSVLSGHTDDVFDIAMSDDGQRVVSASKDGTVGVWDTESGARLLTLVGHVGPVYAVAIDAVRAEIVSAGADAHLRFWDLKTGRPISAVRADESALTALELDPSGKRLAVGSDAGTVRVWDLDRRERLASLRVAVADSVVDLEFSPDGARLAVAFWVTPIVVLDSTPAAERHRIRSAALATREASAPVEASEKK